MVSFVCDGCQETVKKAKINSHAMQCYQSGSFSCIDCGVSFYGGQWRQHNACMTEAEKHQGSLYRGKKGPAPSPAHGTSRSRGQQQAQQQRQGQRPGQRQQRVASASATATPVAATTTTTTAAATTTAATAPATPAAPAAARNGNGSAAHAKRPKWKKVVRQVLRRNGTVMPREQLTQLVLERLRSSYQDYSLLSDREMKQILDSKLRNDQFRVSEDQVALVSGP